LYIRFGVQHHYAIVNRPIRFASCARLYVTNLAITPDTSVATYSSLGTPAECTVDAADAAAADNDDNYTRQNDCTVVVGTALADICLSV